MQAAKREIAKIAVAGTKKPPNLLKVVLATPSQQGRKGEEMGKGRDGTWGSLEGCTRKRM